MPTRTTIKNPACTMCPSPQALIKIFHEHNVDADEGSTTLSRSEAIAALLTLFPSESPTKIVNRISKLDKNSDGELTQEEFLAVGSKFFFSYEDRARAMIIKYNPAWYASEGALQDALADEFDGHWEDLLDDLIAEFGEEPDRDELHLVSREQSLVGSDEDNLNTIDVQVRDGTVVQMRNNPNPPTPPRSTGTTPRSSDSDVRVADPEKNGRAGREESKETLRTDHMTDDDADGCGVRAVCHEDSTDSTETVRTDHMSDDDEDGPTRGGARAVCREESKETLRTDHMSADATPRSTSVNSTEYVDDPRNRIAVPYAKELIAEPACKTGEKDWDGKKKKKQTRSRSGKRNYFGFKV